MLFFSPREQATREWEKSSTACAATQEENNFLWRAAQKRGPQRASPLFGELVGEVAGAETGDLEADVAPARECLFGDLDNVLVAHVDLDEREV